MHFLQAFVSELSNFQPALTVPQPSSEAAYPSEQTHLPHFEAPAKYVSDHAILSLTGAQLGPTDKSEGQFLAAHCPQAGVVYGAPSSTSLQFQPALPFVSVAQSF